MTRKRTPAQIASEARRPPRPRPVCWRPSESERAALETARRPGEGDSPLLRRMIRASLSLAPTTEPPK